MPALDGEVVTGGGNIQVCVATTVEVSIGRYVLPTDYIWCTQIFYKYTNKYINIIAGADTTFS